MEEKVLSDRIKKNLLDLQYSKYLQYFNTTVILLFTYLIAVSVAFITKQVDYTNQKQLLLMGILTMGIFSIITLLLLRFKAHLRDIIIEIKTLKI